MSHHKHHKQYQYKVISSHDLKKKDAPSLEGYLNTLCGQGWDIITLEMKHTERKDVSFLGVMKRNTNAVHKSHKKK